MEKQLEKFDNQYSVSTTGIVYSLKGTKKELKGKISNAGYREVVISHKGKKEYRLVHRLVAEAFIENIHNARTVNHKDGNKLNNSIENLEWLTDSENLKHARDNNTLNCKIDKETALKIKKENGSIRSIAKKYGIGKTQVGYIKQGKRWTE